MRVLFTRGNNLVSWLICKVTGEEVSHCALEQDGVILHSNLYGITLTVREDFLKHCQVIYSLDIPNDSTHMLKMFAKYQSSWYDIGGLLYLGVQRLLPFLPSKRNLWSDKDSFLCTEWILCFLGEDQDPTITPYNLYLKLKERYASDERLVTKRLQEE